MQQEFSAATIEQIILKNLISNDKYARKVLPFIKAEYFHDASERIVFEEIQQFIEKYNALPSIEAIAIELSNRASLTSQQYEEIVAIVDIIKTENDPTPEKWLMESTEEFCSSKALHNAILDSIHIMDGSNKKLDKGAIPQLLQDALSVSLDPYVGHDYIDSAQARYEFYHRSENKLPFDLDYLNRITRGGLPGKTLSCILGGTGTGKTLVMCHLAAAALALHHNVLYITMEMAEERIAERIDANLLDTRVSDLERMPESDFLKRIERLRKTIRGKLIIKEYPTGAASVAHFRALLNDLRLKRNFIPEIVFIDYLNICSSSRLKHGSGVNSYTYIKSIAEELRGLAVEYDVRVITATQTTRSGFSDSDPTLESVSESFGTAHTVDLMIALVTNEELEMSNQILVKQLKNRFSDPTRNKRFMLGVDRDKMRLYNIEQPVITDSGQMPEPDDMRKPSVGGGGKFDGFTY